ncbi:hypothetical protein [Salinibacter altiplanensis]|uniref:hypothetical protein n=1 Tax=Salinibacter altiplanensis TaxID=1803181 RepID=UPI00131A55F6|nr:hypothetical protein [Salinibacter altiplanensis]
MTETKAAPDEESHPESKSVKYLSIDRIRFDPENPRLPPSVDGTSREEVIQWMIRESTLVELMGSIGEEGYFPGEPMLVAPSKTNGERPPIDEARTFDVVEGNRRLGAVLLLNDPGLAEVKTRSVNETASEATHRPDKIPTIQYEKRKEILNYLGYRHITGIQEWSTLSKSKYLSSLKEKFNDLEEVEQYRTLAKRIGSRRDYVERLLTGLELYEIVAREEFFHVENLDPENIDFTVITTALSYTKIATFLGLESGRDPELEGLVEDHLEELVRWMFEKNTENQTRLGDSRNISVLADVVGEEDALEAFRSGKALEEAHNLTGAPTEIFQNQIDKALDSLKSARDQLHLADPTQPDAETLLEIMKLAKTMKSSTEDSIMERGIE